jgi:N6-L-threonylcarbamoyladenine synthase
MVGKDHTFPSGKLPALLNEQQRADIAASFETTAVDTLVDNLLKAYHDYAPKSVVIAGGVAANQQLRQTVSQAIPIKVTYAPSQLCTDNAAMVASAGYFHVKRLNPTDPYSLEIDPSLKLA